MFACIYKTGSRGPWIALALSLGTLLVFNKARVRKYLVVIALLTVSVLVVRPGVGETIWNNYIATLDKNSTQGESYQYRYALYDLAVRELDRSVRRAIFGYGPESFYFLKITGEFNGRVMTFVSCDNSIAALLIETGYLGLLIAMSVLATALVRAYRKCRRVGPRANGIYLVLFVSMATFVFMMTNVAILGWGQENFIFWIVMALSMTYPRLAALEQKRKSETALARPPALVCVGESAQ
jgi:O-antigen ligase